jgi:putative two-component system response regulator
VLPTPREGAGLQFGQEKIRGARILIIDDEAPNVELLRRVLEPAGYENLVTTTDSRRVAELCATGEPDIILLDLKMPHVDGFQVLELLPAVVPDFEFLPVLALTSDTSREAKSRALSNGASDFVNKPLSPAEVRLRVFNLLQTRFLQLALRNQNQLLERKVRQRTADLEEAQFEIVERLALAAEYRDDETGKHTKRVGILSALLARELGWTEEQIEVMRRAAPLHDVGKIGIDSAVLLKPGKLTKEEFDHIKEHVTIGHGILSGSRFPLLQMASEIARYHHENWDGTGYQAGLKGEGIPESARIVTVIDVYDSLTHKRPYKEAWPVEEALAEITKLRGSKFESRVVDAFFSIHERGETDLAAGAQRPEPTVEPDATDEKAVPPEPAGAPQRSPAGQKAAWARALSTLTGGSKR